MLLFSDILLVQILLIFWLLASVWGGGKTITWYVTNWKYAFLESRDHAPHVFVECLLDSRRLQLTLATWPENGLAYLRLPKTLTFSSLCRSRTWGIFSKLLFFYPLSSGVLEPAGETQLLNLRAFCELIVK